MRTSIFFLTVLLAFSGLTLRVSTARPAPPSRTGPALLVLNPTETTVDLRAFGAVGDGVANDGPALQSALNALANAGGGTLLVPAGRYAIITPVLKNFSTSASLSILGVPSLTPVNTQGNGQELTHGLDLTSEFVIMTGVQTTAIALSGLESLLISDMVFIGTPEATTDALTSLGIYNIANAAIRHCEFYGLSTMLAGGAVVHADNSRLSINQTVFLGCTGNSAVRTPVVLSTMWKDLSVTDTIFADWGQRPGFFSKTPLAPAYSWIMIGDAAPTNNLSPRREAIIRNIFLDEGAFIGIAAIPDFYNQQSADSDLIYISDLRMNVSNLHASGIYLTRSNRVLIERAKFEWSQIPAVAVNLLNIGEAVLDRLQCLASANLIQANSATGRLTVINSICAHLDSQAQITEVITTETEEEDPVQYVRRQYLDVLDHEPDGAAHAYWSAKLLSCGSDQVCISARRLELLNYLVSDPSPLFAIHGQVLDQNGVGLGGVTLNLSGSQNVAAQTDTQGRFRFQGLPTSGAYLVRPVRVNYTFPSSEWRITTPSGDRVADFSAILNQYVVAGRVVKPDGIGLAGVGVTLSGSEDGTATTDNNGAYSFTVPAEGDYVVSPSHVHNTFTPEQTAFVNLSSNQSVNFVATLNRHNISGRVTDVAGSPLPGVGMLLSGTESATAITDSAGNYTLRNIGAGGDYLLRAEKQNYSFPSQTLTDLSANQTLNFTGSLVNYTITGRILDSSGQALNGTTVTLAGSATATTTTNAGGNYGFTVLAQGSYTITPSKLHYIFAPTNMSFSNLSENKIANFSGTLQKTLEFSAASYQVGEGQTSLVITVIRNGDTSGPASATYSTSDDSGLGSCSTPHTELASSVCDYLTSVGTLHFAPAETTKTFSILIIDDAYAEGSESFDITLSNLSGVNMGSQGTANVMITDNESVNGSNPIEGVVPFVRQHYVDFFNREPDVAGLEFWTNQITSCGSDAACVGFKRANASAAFFLSIEFRETGYLVYRMYKTAYGNRTGAPVPLRINEFLPDTQQIGRGVVVGQMGWEQMLESNKQAFIADFVARPRFTVAYPTTLTPEQFVDALFTNAGVSPSASERMQAIGEFGGAPNTADVAARGRALRRVAENQTLAQQEFNKAFVLMQYFGYLRRNPNDAPEPTLDFQGYNFWLSKLNQFNGNFVNAEMVKAFIISGEYRQRFGP